MFGFTDHNTGHQGTGYKTKADAIAAAKEATAKRNEERKAVNAKADTFAEHFSVHDEKGNKVHHVENGQEVKLADDDED